MATTVRKDSFKTTNMRFSDLDDKFFNNTNSGVRRIKMSKFIINPEDPIGNGEEFTFRPDVQPAENVSGSGSRLRLDNKYATGPKEATENASISTNLSNISMSHYKNSITFYKVQQTGVDDYSSHSNGYEVHNQTWNGNLNKNIPKEFEQFGTFGASSVNKYACTYTGTAKNLQFQIKGGIYGAGASNQNETGGNAMYVNASGDILPIRIASTAQVYAGGGWGGFGGVGGPGGKGGGTTAVAGGDGGSGGAAGTGGAGQGYTTNAATGTDGESGGDGGGRNTTTWYNGGLSSVDFKFRNANDFHGGGVPVEASGIGFRCISFTISTDDDPEARGTAYTKITGNFYDQSFTFWHPEEDENQESESKSTLTSQRLLVSGGTTGELAVTHDSDASGKKALRKSDSKCIFRDKKGDDANATLTITQYNTNFRYRQSRNFSSGKGGNGGNGGRGGSGGTWGAAGVDGEKGKPGTKGDDATSDNRPKFIRNTGGSSMNISVNGTRTGDYYSVFAVPGLGDYGDSSGNGYGNKTAWNVPSGGYVGPISHWSFAPWDVNGSQLLMGAWTRVQSGGRTLNLDDNGSFDGPDNDYNDLILRINDGSWPQAQFVHHNPGGEGAPSSWSGRAGQSGTAGGIAISGGGYKLINNKSSNYKG